MAIQRVCDLCILDGKNNVVAVGWYNANDRENYDVCKKHEKDVKKVGLEMHYY